MLPYFICAEPKGARSLMEYRYNCLDSARENARHYGFCGVRLCGDRLRIEPNCPGTGSRPR